MKLSPDVWRPRSFPKASATQFPGFRGSAVLIHGFTSPTPARRNRASWPFEYVNPQSLGVLEGGLMSTSCVQPTCPEGAGGLTPSSPLGTSSVFSPFSFSTLTAFPRLPDFYFLAPRNLWCENRQRNLLGCIWKEGSKLGLGQLPLAESTRWCLALPHNRIIWELFKKEKKKKIAPPGPGPGIPFNGPEQRFICFCLKSLPPIKGIFNNNSQVTLR